MLHRGEAAGIIFPSFSHLILFCLRVNDREMMAELRGLPSPSLIWEQTLNLGKLAVAWAITHPATVVTPSIRLFIWAEAVVKELSLRGIRGSVSIQTVATGRQ